MKLKKILTQAKKYIAQSPLAGLEWKGQVKDDEEEVDLSESISKYKEQVDILSQKLRRPMNVVVMGEVKAGKSTLLNAIIGAEVCPSDVLEATATITDIHYSEQEKAAIYRDGELEEVGLIEEINQVLMKHQGDNDFFAGETLTSIGIPMESLTEFHLVDTPGLSTITEANSEKTKNFIQQSDVVLWVFNANHLGQSDVREELANVARLGKPIIGIVNRVDEVNTTPSKLKRYVRRNLDMYLRDVFATSALQAFTARKNNDQQALEESGLAEVLDYLREEIEIKSEEIHNESIISSSKATLRHYIKFNRAYIDKINFIQDKLAEYTKKLEEEKGRIENEVKMLITDKFNNQLFEHERRKIVNQVENISFSGKGPSKKDIVNSMKREFNEQAIQSWWQRIEKKVEDKLQQEWHAVAKEIDEQLQSEFKELAQKEKQLLLEAGADEELLTSETNLLADIGEGAAVAGIGGLGMAAYVATLGPAAASVTIGYAISSIVPPLAIGGAIVFAGKKLLNKDKEKRMLKVQLSEKITKLKRQIKEEWIEGEVLPSISEENNKICDHLQESFVKKLSGGLSSVQLDRLILDLEEHIERGNQLIIELDAE